MRGHSPMRRAVLITGASSSLGEGLACEFAARGYDLALCARHLDKLNALSCELSRAHPELRVAVRKVDVGDASWVAEVFNDFHQHFGQLDRIIIVANPGGPAPLGVGDVNAALRIADINFTCVIAQCDAAMHIFHRQTYGHLVTMSSVMAKHGMPGSMAVYSASKAAVETLSNALRSEMKATGLPIRITTLVPGNICSSGNARESSPPVAVDVVAGCKAMADAIEREENVAFVPGRPWRLIGSLIRWLPAPCFPGALYKARTRSDRLTVR